MASRRLRGFQRVGCPWTISCCSELCRVMSSVASGTTIQSGQWPYFAVTASQPPYAIIRSKRVGSSTAGRLRPTPEVTICLDDAFGVGNIETYNFSPDYNTCAGAGIGRIVK